jgi:hypothetical protein
LLCSVAILGSVVVMGIAAGRPPKRQERDR